MKLAGRSKSSFLLHQYTLVKKNILRQPSCVHHHKTDPGGFPCAPPPLLPLPPRHQFGVLLQAKEDGRRDFISLRRLRRLGEKSQIAVGGTGGGGQVIITWVLFFFKEFSPLPPPPLSFDHACDAMDAKVRGEEEEVASLRFFFSTTSFKKASSRCNLGTVKWRQSSGGVIK